jgi:lysophospholipase L1-like esterase
MTRIALIGDSIFDNAAYTRGEPDVVTHLRGLLGSGGTALLCAVDGAVTRDVGRQLARVPAEATHVVLSVGGNDVLGHYDLLNMPVRSTAEALALFGRRAAAFEDDYQAALGRVLLLDRPTAACTIYNGNLGPDEAPLARTALAIFNDAIVRTALRHGLHVIELRNICTEPADYANPIEPSGTGGLKIARAIADWATRTSAAARTDEAGPSRRGG